MQTLQFDIENSFQVRRMSSSSFYMVLLLFLLTFFIVLFCVLANEITIGFFTGGVFLSLAIYNLYKKHNTDELFIEVDAFGIWTRDREITSWDNYKCTYLSAKDSWDYNSYGDKEIDDSDSSSIQPVINIEHYKDGESGYFIHQLFFNGSEDRVEDDVLNAIEFYYRNRSFNTITPKRKMLR